MQLLFLSALIVMLTHLLEGIAGFGGAVMALPFLNLTIGLERAVHLLCLLGSLMSLYIVLRSGKHINLKEFSFIALFSGCGLPLGLWLFAYLPALQLCILLGFFMIAVGVHGVLRHRNASGNATPCPSKKSNYLMLFLLFCGGIFQGAFGSGGPCIVIYSAKNIPQKEQFRATLSLLWLTMNCCRLGVWSYQGDFWNPDLLKDFAFILPFMLAGLLIGDCLHRKVNEKLFKSGIYLLLAVSGIIMAVNNFLRLLQR